MYGWFEELCDCWLTRRGRRWGRDVSVVVKGPLLLPIDVAVVAKFYFIRHSLCAWIYFYIFFAFITSNVFFSIF